MSVALLSSIVVPNPGQSYNPYIPWDVGMFYDAITNLRGMIGTAFNFGFWIFMIISGVYLVIKIIDGVGN